MARPKGTADLAPMIRGAAMRALKHNENRGKGLTMILAESFVEKPLETLTALAKFNPSQSKLDVTHKIEIADIIALAQQRQAAMKDITPTTLELQANCVHSDNSLIDKAIDEGLRPSSSIRVTVKVPEP